MHRGSVSKILIVTLSVTCGLRPLRAAADDGHAHPENVTGRFWERVFDSRHPAAPPRLIPVKKKPAALQPQSEQGICAQSGQRIVVHQDRSGSAGVSLAAVALQSAACGEHARVRITVTGAVREVTLVGSGEGVMSGGGSAWK